MGTRLTKSEVETLGSSVAIKLNSILNTYQSKPNCPQYLMGLAYKYNTEYGLYTQYINSSGIGNQVQGTAGVTKDAYQVLYTINRTLEFCSGLLTGQVTGLI